jgi:hypothetical protein
MIATWLMWMSLAGADQGDVAPPVSQEPRALTLDVPLAVPVAPAVDVRDAVVVVHHAGGTCAGSVIDAAGTIVTAYHCVTSGWRARVETRDGVWATARVLSSKPRWDLAVLSAPDLAGKPALQVAATPPAVKDTVWAVGHPLAAAPPYGFLQGTLRWSVTEGIASAVGPVAVQTSASLNPGNSGGPLVNEADELVGVVSRKAGEGLGFATRSDKVTELLAAPQKHGFGGGTITSYVAGSTLLSGSTVGTLGVGLQASLRDLLTLDVTATVPLATRWDLIDQGTATSVPISSTLGVRGRLGHGPMALRAGLYGGVGAVLTQTATLTSSEDDLTVAPGLGGRVEWLGLGVGLGVWHIDGAWPMVLEIRGRLPGEAVF